MTGEQLNDLRSNYPYNYDEYDFLRIAIRLLVLFAGMLVVNGLIHKFLIYIPYVTPLVYLVSGIMGFITMLISIAAVSDEKFHDSGKVKEVKNTDRTNWTEIDFFCSRMGIHIEKVISPCHSTVSSFSNMTRLIESNLVPYSKIKYLYDHYPELVNALSKISDQSKALRMLSPEVPENHVDTIIQLQIQMAEYFNILKRVHLLTANFESLVKLEEIFEDYPEYFRYCLSEQNGTNN